MNVDARSTLRRANPLFMLVVGALIGALVTGIGREPSSSNVEAVAGGGGSPVAVESTGDGAVAVTPGATYSGAGGAVSGGAPTAAAPGSPGGGVTPTSTGTAVTRAAGGACAGSPSSGARGVTATTVKVGFAIPDIRAVVAVFGKQVDPGDMAGHVRAILDGMRKDGRLPVCGRDIVPVFREYNVLDPAASRSVCVAFTQQDKVFAVIALFAFGAADCVTQENRTFLLDLGVGLSEEDYKASPLLFGTDPSYEWQLRSFANMLIETNLVDGKTIGIYYNSAVEAQVKANLLDVLAKAGHPVKVTVTTDAGTGQMGADPNDGVAVQRFRVGGVNLAISLAAGSNFYRQAELQNYKAQWAVYGVALASDATTAQYPKATFDGARALLWDHVGEVKSGIPLSAEQQRCLGYWRKAGHDPGNPDFGEGQTIRESCDQLTIFTHALRAAGNNLTTPTLVGGMETIRDLTLSYYSDQTFVPGKHWGATENVVEEWHGDCSCWKLVGPWVPIYGYR